MIGEWDNSWPLTPATGPVTPASGPLTPALLRCCREIHSEAAPVLYWANTFHFSYPLRALRWINVIGPRNTELLRDLRIFVEAVVERSSRDGWCELFKILGRKAKRLRWMYIYLDQYEIHRGLGFDESFVRALAGIKSLDSLEISGYFSREWPDYLGRNMGVRVLTT